MKGRLKSGKIINGRLAEFFVSRGIAVEVKEKEIPVTDESKITASDNKQVVKRKRRTKAEIESDKKNKS
jgi:hypothetical protein